MKNILLIESGVAFGEGKLIPYAEFFEAVRLLSDGKIAKKLEDRVLNMVAFENTNREISYDLKDQGRILGLKPEANVEKLRKQILKRIEKLNGQNNR